MGDIAEFWARWLAFVRGYRDSDIDLRSRLVDRVLASGLDAGLAFCGTDWTDDAANALVDPADRMTCEHDLIAASRAFDESGYVWRNRELHWSLCRHLEGLRHFVRYGWRHLRNPSLEFDVWWYWITYLDPAAEVVNPLVHYLAEGRHLGHATIPPVEPVRVPPPPLPGGPRRVCLFAGYDGDGLIDENAVTYVRELSRFADVYYLADCHLEAGELDKLAPYTSGRWTIRHGRYDFGSYSMLARDLVGWDMIATYDELLLANDSCYLLRPWTRCSPPWTPARRTGGACRPPTMTSRREISRGWAAGSASTTWWPRPAALGRGASPTASTWAPTSSRCGRR